MTHHVYLSTACLHDQHRYCSSPEGRDGIKVPKRCKWCPSLCVCPCHALGANGIQGSDLRKRGAENSPEVEHSTHPL